MLSELRTGHGHSVFGGLLPALIIGAIVSLCGESTLSAPRIPVVRAVVSTLRVPDEGIQPQMATDSKGNIHLVYFKGNSAHGDLFYVRSDDSGKTFSKPIRVNSEDGSAIALGTIRGAQLAIGKGDRIHVAWNGSNTATPKVGKSAPMLYARLTDKGDAFEPQRNLIQNYAGIDGGGSVAADADGNVYVAWHAPKDQETEADRWVWISRSKDDGKTFAPEISANANPTGACGCCALKVFAGAEGSVYVVYRTATQKVHRDIHLLVSGDHGMTFTDRLTDPWEVDFCVMSSAAMASVPGGIIAAWETREQIMLARVEREKTIKPGSVPGDAKGRKHPAVAVNSKGEFVIAWDEGTAWNKGGSIAWQLFDKDARPIAGQSGSAKGLPAWSMPAVFTDANDHFVVMY